MKNKAVFGIVRTQVAAESIISDLRALKFATSDISVLFPNKGASRDFSVEKGTKSPEGAVVGGGAGGVAGGVLGLLAGIGALVIPGLGALVAAGPVMALLSGAAVGAAVGSLAGALVGLGIPEIQAKAYAGKIEQGNILVAVHVADGKQVDVVKQVFKNAGADDISVTHEAAVPSGKKPSPTGSVSRF